jgi:hypothetical protein
MGAVEERRAIEPWEQLSARIGSVIRQYVVQPSKDTVEQGQLVSDVQKALESNLDVLAMYALDWE